MINSFFAKQSSNEEITFYTLLIILAFMITNSCVKDHRLEKTDNSVVGGSNSINIQECVLKINEFVAKGSVNQNEFENDADWIEIYKPNNHSVTFEADRWYITDDYIRDPRKYKLPSETIAAKGYLVIWANNEDRIQSQIHANFALSSSGESLGLIYADSNNNDVYIDAISYPLQTTDAVNNVTIPNGLNSWGVLNVPTLINN